MGKTIKDNKANILECPECHMKYYDEGTAKKCEAWCRKNKSCNLDIIKYAIR